MPGSAPSRTKSLVRWPFLIAALFVAPPAIAQLRAFTVVGDTIPQSLTGQAGDAARGRTVVTDRQKGLCVLCHTGPFPEQRFQGNLAPDLRGTGSRWDEGQLRLRLVDSSKVNPPTIMPAYYRLDGLTRVGGAWQGKPVLSADEVEDVVAFLLTLKDMP
ncbi:sulfur oxidation c-type cytochrome SoxX [Neorhizobium galegae]|uniref:sulfur oxidation c-type cytochrome SoxX n=1 Tax=Neorhizobium galegae TaxID=399 RepID=UPI000627D6EB|nr:sulfur oxidation c-type cytochrome SoxX [Neorhizobium galegae]KAB1122964.1 sulfur oxidation c-type cytochrome SoxX [Neorhizobium galegae]